MIGRNQVRDKTPKKPNSHSHEVFFHLQINLIAKPSPSFQGPVHSPRLQRSACSRLSTFLFRPCFLFGLHFLVRNHYIIKQGSESQTKLQKRKEKSIDLFCQKNMKINKKQIKQLLPYVLILTMQTWCQRRGIWKVFGTFTSNPSS